MKHELSSMKAFVILAESSSFNNAAKLLNITQSALTNPPLYSRYEYVSVYGDVSVYTLPERSILFFTAGNR